MTLLNLKTFINVTVKKNKLYYYSHEDYNIFTDGVITYGILKDNNSDEAAKIFEELYKNRTIEMPLSKSLDDVVSAYKTGSKKHVTDCDQIFIPNIKALTVFYGESDTENCIVINEKYKKCCKASPKGGKDQFVIETKLKNKDITLYFESSQQTSEFIMVMPIELGK